MIEIKTFQVNPIQENCYVVSDETAQCIIIDCGAYYDSERNAIVNYLKEHCLMPVHLLCTHGHFDHNFGNDTIYAEFGVKPEIHAADRYMIEDLAQHCLSMGMNYNRTSPPTGNFLYEGQAIEFGSHQLHVVHTPGHTEGSVMFHCPDEQIVFTGDTLFRMSVGRTDLPGGSWPQLMKSLHAKVALLPPDTIVYPGHGPKTAIIDEVKMNPYFN